jgi:hypothetical protein
MCVTCLLCPCSTTATGLKPNCSQIINIYNIYTWGKPGPLKTNVKVTPLMMATIEISCEDRWGVTPQHILYMALKILRLRVRYTFRCVGETEHITKRMIEDKEYLECCIQKNLSFLKPIPNSLRYWQQRKQDVFSMIRQLGKLTMFLTLSASEVRWSHLLQILCKLQGEPVLQIL